MSVPSSEIQTSDQTHNTHNYFAHGGNELVIDGKLTLLSTAELDDSEGILGSGGGIADYQEASTATTIALLKDDFNALLVNLKNAGLMQATQVK